MFQREKLNKSLSSQKQVKLYKSIKKDSKLKVCVAGENSPSYKIMKLVSNSDASCFKLNECDPIQRIEDNFTGCNNFRQEEHKEIKEEAELSSSSHEKEKQAFKLHRRQLQSSRLVGQPMSDLSNPFVEIKSGTDSKKSGCTPDFKAKIKGNVFNFNTFKSQRRKDSVDYNEPSRYLYEFFTDKKFIKFRSKFISYANEIKHKVLPNFRSLKKDSLSKKYLYLEILNTLIIVRSKENDTLPEL